MAWCWGIGKGRVVKVKKAGQTSPSIGIVSALRTEVGQEAISFMAACCGEHKSSNVWCASEGMVGRANIVFAPKLQSLLQQMDHFGSMQIDPNFNSAFGDTQMSLDLEY